ncbi:deoxyribonuclease gamma [Octopus bimaculoides]|uniref:Deoxyribonuclease n=1 Tax=Octopus bimaculoides TaxID=37653 RepID=A0A0L8HGK6_OCTBM|nr:deoxyribonuclease gamma [Octopus bimaculoides]|eukprot:XP_014772757.1 PREDICTED: deoxyribonuclease gamma-like isoform X1 [Octopus bimaculoides]
MPTDNQFLKCLLLLTIVPLSYATFPRIGALNVQDFNPSKIDNKAIVGVLFKIVARYEIVFLQQIKGMSDDDVETLMSKVKQRTRENFGYKLSKPLGDDKEQYGFLYRKKHIKYNTQTLSKKTANLFRRPPLVGTFSLPYDDITEVTIIGIHVDSDNVKEEMDSLVEVINELEKKVSQKNFVIMGTLNTDCQYCNDECKKNLLIVKDMSYKWLISDDTTVEDNSCTYDQAIITGSNLKHVVQDAGSVFHFDKEYKLSAQMAEKVTDHYPIEFALQVTTEKPNSTLKTPQPEVTTTNGGSNLVIEISLGLLCMTLLLL